MASAAEAIFSGSVPNIVQLKDSGQNVLPNYGWKILKGKFGMEDFWPENLGQKKCGGKIRIRKKCDGKIGAETSEQEILGEFGKEHQKDLKVGSFYPYHIDTPRND